MILVNQVVGNSNDAAWRLKLRDATVDEIRLDQWQAQKNRFRLKSAAGTEVAVALERNTHLHEGDILVWDEPGRSAIIARIQLQDVFVIELGALLDELPETMARTCFELGHALGNQHWPAVVKGTTVYVPLTVDRKVMASVMRTHAFAGISYEFRPGQTVIPFLAPHEARRLFGGADSTPHSHLPADVMAQSNLPEHTHTNAQGRTYSHRHPQEHASDSLEAGGIGGGAAPDHQRKHEPQS